MKNWCFVFLPFLVLLSCGKEEKLVFEYPSYQGADCTGCPAISVDIPMAMDRRKVSESVNRAIREEVISLLAYQEEDMAENIPMAIASFSKGFESLRSEFPDESVPWEANIKGEVLFENAELLTVYLNSYIFTGGAHGYTAIRFLNFKKSSGRELENEELFTNIEAFKELAERQFRNRYQIPAGDPINSRGFMFENDVFYLPENIGCSPDGIRLAYNPYEVASYAEGVVELNIPYAEIRKFLVFRP